MKEKTSMHPILFIGLPTTFQRKIRRITTLPDKLPKIIFEAVDIVFDVSHEDILSPHRKLQIAHARHAYCYLLKTNSKYSLQEIGDILGGRNHTTVLHSVRVASNYIETDKNYAEQILVANQIIKCKRNGTYFHKK